MHAFGTLAVQTDNGILVQSDVSTVAGSMFFDGDVDNSLSGDATNAIIFGTGTRLLARARGTGHSRCRRQGGAWYPALRAQGTGTMG